MDKALADFSVKYALKRGASYAEARLEENESSGFLLKNSNLDVSGFDINTGIGIRFLINKSLGLVSTNELDKEEIKRLIEEAISTTRKSSKISDETGFSEYKAVKKSYHVKQSEKIQDKSITEKLNFLLNLDKGLKDAQGRYISFSDTLSKKYYTNSEGSEITSEIPRLGIVFYLTVTENNKSAQIYKQMGASSGYEVIKKWQLEKNIKGEIDAIRNNLKKGSKSPKGKLDVVIGPEITGIAVHESVGHPYEADRILGREGAQAGESFVNRNMLNTKIGSNVVNVVDDPTLENSSGFYLYDDEGVKARKKHLIKNGIISEFLHNRSTSSIMNTKSNGSARANTYNVEPIIRMSNTFALPGNHTVEELIEDIKLGIYMKTFMEWNIDDKRFNQKYTANDAYLIKNGKIVKPIRNPKLEITTPSLWRSIDAVGKDIDYNTGSCGKGEPMQAIPVWFGGPSLRLRNVHIT